MRDVLAWRLTWVAVPDRHESNMRRKVSVPGSLSRVCTCPDESKTTLLLTLSLNPLCSTSRVRSTRGTLVVVLPRLSKGVVQGGSVSAGPEPRGGEVSLDRPTSPGGFNRPDVPFIAIEQATQEGPEGRLILLALHCFCSTVCELFQGGGGGGSKGLIFCV